jgi:nucleoid DNA-binding protein
MSTKPTAKPGPKGAAAPKPKTAPAEAAAAPGAEAASRSADGDRAGALKLRELVVRVSEATGGKKKGVREIVEATLAALGSALEKGEELNLPGVGKVRVAKSVDRAGRATMTLKVRSAGAPKPKEALAEAEEAV